MIGRLNKRIEIYHINDENIDKDLGTNEPKEEFLKEIWADIQPRTGSLMMGREAGTMLSKTTHVIQIRSEMVGDVTNDCHIIWTDEFKNNHRFDIDYILPPSGALTTNIYCQEVT